MSWRGRSHRTREFCGKQSLGTKEREGGVRDKSGDAAVAAPTTHRERESLCHLKAEAWSVLFHNDVWSPWWKVQIRVGARPSPVLPLAPNVENVTKGGSKERMLKLYTVHLQQWSGTKGRAEPRFEHSFVTTVCGAEVFKCSLTRPLTSRTEQTRLRKTSVLKRQTSVKLIKYIQIKTWFNTFPN